jgi:hypothetical protein
MRNGRCLGRKGLSEANFALKCQLDTVPYFAVITAKYGVTFMVVRRITTSTVRTVLTVIVPYLTT